MSQKCELLDNCGFFKKYQDLNTMACQGFINLYCLGPKMDECKRKEYREKNGAPPPDNMMPSGLMIPGS